MNRVRQVTLVGLWLCLCVGCSTAGPDDGYQVRQTAGIHVVARQLVTLDGIACARGAVDSQGLPRPPVGSLRMDLTFGAGVPEARQQATILAAAESVWRSDLDVRDLTVYAGASGLSYTSFDPKNPSRTGPEVMAEQFGPKPAPPGTPAQVRDPGNPECGPDGAATLGGLQPSVSPS